MEMELDLIWIQIQILFPFTFKPSQLELVWKLRILPYNDANLNSYFGRPRQIIISGNLLDFSKQVWTPNKLQPFSNAVLLSVISIQILFRIWTFF
jgi:hypothetical protein